MDPANAVIASAMLFSALVLRCSACWRSAGLRGTGSARIVTLLSSRCGPTCAGGGFWLRVAQRLAQVLTSIRTQPGDCDLWRARLAGCGDRRLPALRPLRGLATRDRRPRALRDARQ